MQTLYELEKLLSDLSKYIPKKYVRTVNKYLEENVSGSRSRVWLLKLACIFHDIGKPATRSVSSDGKVHFYAHERKGAAIVKDIGRRMKFSTKEISALKDLVGYHLRAGQIVNGVPSRRAKFRFFRDAKEHALSILLLTIADRRAMKGKLSRRKDFVFLEEEIFNMIVAAFKQEKEKRKKEPLIDGNEILRLLKIKPSPVIGKMIKEMEEAQALSLIENKKEARNLVKKLYMDLMCLPNGH